MKVLLKRKQKRKGMSKYDPRPFTLVELVGRQAVITRGDTTLRRETQKIKKFHEPSPQPTKTKTHLSQEDDWEETSYVKSSNSRERDRGEGIENRQNETTTEPEEVGQIQEGERASSEINTEPARRSLRENRGRPPARFGEWTNK